MKSHQVLAEQLDLLHFEAVAPGMVFWHPNGCRLFQSVENQMRDNYLQHDFLEIKTPLLLKQALWQISGHLDQFRAHMFLGGEFDEAAEYALKPMSCPAHILYYKRGIRSYRDLPVRVFEFGNVHRNEPSGALNGCLRLRQFTQDDAHVFCEWSQAKDEVLSFLQRAKQVYYRYGFDDIQVKLSTRPAQAFGDANEWLRAEKLLADACRAAGYQFEYQIGEGAFYGPKIELTLRDAMGRAWQCGTIQLDFNLPNRFNIHYVDAEQCQHHPIILHQAMYGSIERWIGILLESYQGQLPLWLHPVPIALAAVDNRVSRYLDEVSEQLNRGGIFHQSDGSDATIARKIRRFYRQKIPIILVIGVAESERRFVSVRQSNHREIERVSLTDLQDYLQDKISQSMSRKLS